MQVAQKGKKKEDEKEAIQMVNIIHTYSGYKTNCHYCLSNFYLLSLTIHEATKTVSINTKDLTLKTTVIEIEGKT